MELAREYSHPLQPEEGMKQVLDQKIEQPTSLHETRVVHDIGLSF
jgi:hypothetical protein